MPALPKPLCGRAPGALSIFTAIARRASASAEIGRPVRGDVSGDGVGVGVAVGTGVGVGVGVARGVGVGGAVGRATATAVGRGAAVPPGVGVSVGGAVGTEVDVAVDVGGWVAGGVAGWVAGWDAGGVAGWIAGIETAVDPAVGMAVGAGGGVATDGACVAGVTTATGRPVGVGAGAAAIVVCGAGVAAGVGMVCGAGAASPHAAARTAAAAPNDPRSTARREVRRPAGSIRGRSPRPFMNLSDVLQLTIRRKLASTLSVLSHARYEREMAAKGDAGCGNVAIPSLRRNAGDARRLARIDARPLVDRVSRSAASGLPREFETVRAAIVLGDKVGSNSRKRRVASQAKDAGVFGADTRVWTRWRELRVVPSPRA